MPAGSLPVAWEVMAEDPFACLRTSAASAVSSQLRAAFRLPGTFLRASGHLPPLEWLVLWPERSKISSSRSVSPPLARTGGASTSRFVAVPGRHCRHQTTGRLAPLDQANRADEVASLCAGQPWMSAICDGCGGLCRGSSLGGCRRVPGWAEGAAPRPGMGFRVLGSLGPIPGCWQRLDLGPRGRRYFVSRFGCG